MFVAADKWNADRDRLLDETLLESPLVRFTQLPAAKAIEFVLPDRVYRHPWWTTPRWSAAADRWEVIIKPGFINGQDPIIPGLEQPESSPWYDAEFPDEPASLLDRAWIPVRGYRSGLAFESAPVVQFFRARGVRTREDEQVQVDPLGNISLTRSRDESTLPERQLRAVDFYLARARATMTPAVTEVDGSGTSGLTVDYAVAYNTAVLDQAGARPRLLQTAAYVPQRPPTLAERLQGLYADEGEDRVRVSTLYLLSPEEAEGEPDGSWTPFVQHHLFWNLHYSIRNTVPRTPPRPIRLQTGLALGLGDALGNQALSGLNEWSALVMNAVNNSAPEGTYHT